MVRVFDFQKEVFLRGEDQNAKKMGEEGISMEHEFEYPKFEFNRELIYVDDQALVRIIMRSMVYDGFKDLVEVELESHYVYNGDKDVDTEMHLSMEFHDKCFKVFVGNEDPDDINMDNKRFE
tara:strand:- start:735 stop:1100 length:366 start_codon:yes stop_codon:yes gene_type:complete